MESVFLGRNQAMVALARVQKPRAEIIVILYLQIIGKLPVPSLTAVLVTVTRLALGL